MSKIRLSGSNSGYVEIAAAADAGNLTFTMPTTGTALFGNGNNVISGITTFSAALDINSTVDVSGTSVFNNDVTFDGATAGYDVVWDRSDNALEFAANAKATFGNNQDMQLYHDGNNSLIQDSGTGHVQVRSGTFTVGNAGLTKTSAIFNSGSGQQLNFNNSPKFITTNTGVVITGICTATSFSGDGSALTGVISDIVADTSPQLGGNLDVQAREINTSTTNGNIKFTPNGTGVVEVRGAGGNDGTLQLNCSAQSHGIKLKSPPHSAGASYTLTFPNNIVDGQFLKTDSSGNLSWASGSLSSRSTTSATTGSIAQAASTNLTIPTAGKSFSLLSLTISAPAYVILYVDTTTRSADSSRSEGTDPAPGSGVITEVSTTASGSTTFLMTPAVLGWNNDGTPAAQIYAKVVNKRATSGSNAITVTLKTVALEA